MFARPATWKPVHDDFLLCSQGDSSGRRARELSRPMRFSFTCPRNLSHVARSEGIYRHPLMTPLHCSAACSVCAQLLSTPCQCLYTLGLEDPICDEPEGLTSAKTAGLYIGNCSWSNQHRRYRFERAPVVQRETIETTSDIFHGNNQTRFRASK